MARQPTAAHPDGPAAPRLVRPTREHALEFAQEMLLRGDRVDMASLCAELGIGRTTLYRWVGDREQLMGEVLAHVADLGWDIAVAEAKGTGIDRAMDAGRRFMEVSSAFRPVRQFVEREPQLALRVLALPEGRVATTIQTRFRAVLVEWAPTGTDINDEFIEIAAQVGTALLWTPIAIGAEPEVDRGARMVRALFDDGQRRG